MIIMTEDEKLNFKELLKSNIVEVEFTKINGEQRVMNCTLLESYLPPTDSTKSKSQDNSLAVWDIDKNGWRSFRYENITSFGLKNQ